MRMGNLLKDISSEESSIDLDSILSNAPSKILKLTIAIAVYCASLVIVLGYCLYVNDENFDASIAIMLTCFNADFCLILLDPEN